MEMMTRTKRTSARMRARMRATKATKATKEMTPAIKLMTAKNRKGQAGKRAQVITFL